MLVSVIIPSYNRGHVLSRAIESVLAQTHKEIELIVIDDGSTDNTDQILNKYSEIKIIKTLNRGVSAARNSGIEIAKGEFIAFLDSDDEWLNNKLEAQLQFLSENKDFEWVHSDEIWIRSGVRVNQMKKHAKGGGDQFLASLARCVISPSTVMLKAYLLKEEKFREDFVVCEDYDLWLRLTHRFPIGYVEDFLIKKYGGHEDQLSKSIIGMDLYRVRSLDSLLSKDVLDVEQSSQVLSVLSKKLKILHKGALKHNNETMLKSLETLIVKYESYIS